MNQIIKPQTYTAAVASVVNVAGEFHVAKLKFAEPKTMPYTAGQYVICKIGPPKGNHTLSIASAPSTDGTIELLQSVAPMGEGSKWLLGLKPGDPVELLGPLGKFVLQKESARPKVFVATGCGIAPLRAMIVDALGGPVTPLPPDGARIPPDLTIGNNPKEEGCAPSGPFRRATPSLMNPTSMVLYWGLRHERDVFWKEEFKRLAVEHPNFRFVLTLSKPTEAWEGAKGRVTEHVLKDIETLDQSEFYLCGNRQMIVDMRGLLTDNGVHPEQIFTETFF